MRWRLPPILALALTVSAGEPFAVMGTHGRFRFEGEPAAVRAAEHAAAAELEAVRRCCDLYDPESELSRLNAAAGAESFHCSELLYDLLVEARRAWRESGGAFDVSAGPLLRCWGFRGRRAEPPSETEIATARRAVGLEKVRFCDAERSVFFTVPGMELDLGGIAKGYAIDRAFRAARAMTDGALLVDLGGNLRFRAASGPVFRVGIRDPFGGEGAAVHVPCAEGAVSTSGGYERFVEYRGKRLPHILDPATGHPAAGAMLAVTVFSPSAVEADWMSTAGFLRGAPLAEKLARLRPGTRFYLFEAAPPPARYRLQVIPAAGESEAGDLQSPPEML